ncbi:MAG: hypothetical protein Q4B06_04300 [Candidatus Saccharibacteria bacterium]|nr:hypothetical protein [Candidatus Saccharibacteria bacterium]
MKITKKQTSITALAVAAMVLSAGTYHIIDTGFDFSKQVYAYTSAENNVDPETAQPDYVINFPDATLKELINAKIDPGRAATQDITAGDMKQLGDRMHKIDLRKDVVNKTVGNIEGLQFFANTLVHSIDLVGQPITSIAPLSALKNVKNIYIAQTNVADLSPLSGLANLKQLYADETPITSLTPLAPLTGLEELSLYKTTLIEDASPLRGMVNLQHLSLSETQIKDVSPLQDMVELKHLHLGSMQVTDISPLAGLTKLQQWYSYDQKYKMPFPKDVVLLKNPVKTIDGTIVPILETANVKNADADGTLNPNGEYIKLVDVYDQGSLEVDWYKTFKHASVVNAQGGSQDVVFSGKITITYDLPARDVTNPTFNPAAPAKIVSRKGRPITITDVTAQDNPGGVGLSDEGVTNNAAGIGLDPANPAKGDYRLTYTAKDKNNNTATVDREIEITDADRLQQELDKVTPTLLNGNTPASVAKVEAAAQAARAIIADNSSTQDQIDLAFNALNLEILSLEVDLQPLVDAEAEYAAQPDYIKNDPIVLAAFRKAQGTHAAPDPTADDVLRDAQALKDAIADAVQAEADAQADAGDALDHALQSLNDPALPPNEMPLIDFTDIEDLIAEVQDATKRDELEKRLKDLRKAFDDRQAWIAANPNGGVTNLPPANNQPAPAPAQTAQDGVAAPNTGFQQDRRFGIAMVVGSVTAAVLGVVYLFRGRR